MLATREQIQQEALTRAVSGLSFTNWPAIIAGFAAKGIPESEIKPRQNVFTYEAWRALGRQVRKGEHGVKVLTFRPGSEREEIDPQTGERRIVRRPSRPWTATVFHESQTDPVRA
jgi:hypothetical protein